LFPGGSRFQLISLVPIIQNLGLETANLRSCTKQRRRLATRNGYEYKAEHDK
jgi:hypothetical protein